MEKVALERCAFKEYGGFEGFSVEFIFFRRGDRRSKGEIVRGGSGRYSFELQVNRQSPKADQQAR